MNILTKIANELGNDRGTKSFEAHGYTDLYYSLFYLWQNNPIKMLEIGVYDPISRYINKDVEVLLFRSQICSNGYKSRSTTS